MAMPELNTESQTFNLEPVTRPLPVVGPIAKLDTLLLMSFRGKISVLPLMRISGRRCSSFESKSKTTNGSQSR